ncbi:protein FAM32A [Staphylotrichum tortipilum]|uniref:Protein FAM32A n=1 Tax=Staphylotrichum tortipilum TaxID=2831512 RepID=A0AAN6RUP6_9PEZI|nr:protein FAM32A [Staphylotrichum longicolle]
MPSDDYTSISRGPLKLKGAAGVTKKKKKKDKSIKPTDLEKNLSTGGDSDRALAPAEDKEDNSSSRRKDSPDSGDDDDARRRRQRKRREGSWEEGGAGGEGGEQDDNKTETERRFAEAKRKRLKELTESGRIRPELLKTHKERVEELNAHLARLSEHHDMPKIGPG